MSAATNTGSLNGLVVVELAHIMAGPVCGLLLADLGANVIKVERHPEGDPSRDMVPPRIGDESAAFMMLNRGKRGVAVNLKRPAGREVALRLLDRADIVIESFRTGTLERLGLGYDTLRDRNPRLILAGITGFGRTGPFAGLAGFDLIAQGYSGLMSVTGELADRPPVKCGVPITDITAGLLAAIGILAAVVERSNTGMGQRVDTSLFEAGIIHTFWQSAITLATGQSPGPLGSAHPLTAPYEAYQTTDGWITIGASSEASWARLPIAIGCEELLEDRRFRTNADRMANRDALNACLTDVLKARTTEEWLQRLADAGVPAGPVMSIGDMLRHPQTKAREMVTTVDHLLLGNVETLGTPVKLSSAPTPSRRGAPILGQHTREVLREYGYAEAEIDALVREDVVHSADG